MRPTGLHHNDVTAPAFYHKADRYALVSRYAAKILNYTNKATFYFFHHRQTASQPLLHNGGTTPTAGIRTTRGYATTSQTAATTVNTYDTFHNRRLKPDDPTMPNTDHTHPEYHRRQPGDPSDNRQLIEHLNQRIAELQHQLEQQSRLAELGNLAAALSHDIRSALNIIKNLTVLSAEATQELLAALPPVGSPLTEEQNQHIQELVTDIVGNSEHVSNNSARATQIVNTVLMSSQGRHEQYQLVPINHLIENHTRLAYQAARTDDPSFNVTLRYEFDDHIGDLIATPSDIGRVIINIVSNSCHATNARQQAEPNYNPVITIGTRGHTDHIMITIEDNGIGMPPSVAEQIFTRFFTTKPPDIGTGLGLAITQEIIHRHGGTITADSAPGSHTTFTVKLPRIPEEFQR